MSTFDLTLHAADQWQLAEHLRHVADRIDRLGPACLPDAGEEKAVMIDGETVGAMSQPGHMTAADRLNLGSAALVGDASLMRRVSNAQGAILSLLQDDLNGLRELNSYHRHGLLLALDELAGSLGERAAFIEEECPTVEMTKE